MAQPPQCSRLLLVSTHSSSQQANPSSQVTPPQRTATSSCSSWTSVTSSNASSLGGVEGESSQLAAKSARSARKTKAVTGLWCLIRPVPSSVPGNTAARASQPHHSSNRFPPHFEELRCEKSGFQPAIRTPNSRLSTAPEPPNRAPEGARHEALAPVAELRATMHRSRGLSSNDSPQCTGGTAFLASDRRLRGSFSPKAAKSCTSTSRRPGSIWRVGRRRSLSWWWWCVRTRSATAGRQRCAGTP